MPSQFLPPKRAGSSSKRSTKKIILIVGSIIAVLVILTAIIVYAFMVTTSQEEVAVNTSGANANSAVNTNNVNGAANSANTNATNTNGTANANDAASINNANAAANANSANTNGTANTNTSNTNTGTAINTNVNDGLAVNINEGLFPDGNTNSTNTNDASNTNTATDVFLDHSDVVDTRDKDRDSLTDTEEEIYGTTFSLPDTDKDGYIDGVEVKNGFSPTEPDKTLLESGLAVKYKSKPFGWNVLYPSQWVAEPINETNREVRFTADTVAGEFVDVIVMENTKHESAAVWFAGLYENVEPQDLQTVRVGSLNGIVSPDGFMYYLANEDVIVGIIYNFGSSTQISFRTTFAMMINSFQYTGPKEDNSATQ